MGLADLEQLLTATMGLNVASIGTASIERAVQERLSACKIADLPAYMERILESGTELQALIEAVVVPETWFFRDRLAFAALTHLAHEDWLRAHPDGIFSLLSLPCSTGEEPYSMAMALLDASFPANRFRVDAVDISARHIAQGVRAEYGRNSFRGRELAFRHAHFDETTDGYRLREPVRRQVRFQQGNLFSPDLLPGEAIYDVIFCRNVLIYCDRAAQDRAHVVLNRLLRANGVLFVAPAETGLASSHNMVSTNEPLAFAFRKTSGLPLVVKQKSTPVGVPAARRRTTEVVPPLRAADRKPVPREAASIAVAPPAPPADPALELEDATQLADRGRFAEAAARCEDHLRRHGPSARAFYLMGLVRDATGNASDAAAYYRKALYLDPGHYDTQIQLALLIEKQGDVAGARVLRTRARRLEQKSRAPHE